MVKQKSGTSKHQVNLRLTPSLHRDVSDAAAHYGVSRNQFIVKAVEQAVWATQAAMRGSSTAEPLAHNQDDAGSSPAPATDPNIGVPDAPVTAFADVQLRKEAEASVALDGETQSFPTEEEVWGEPHVHKCDQLVPNTVHYDKGTRYAQYRCECGKIAIKRYVKKAM